MHLFQRKSISRQNLVLVSVLLQWRQFFLSSLPAFPQRPISPRKYSRRSLDEAGKPEEAARSSKGRIRPRFCRLFLELAMLSLKHFDDFFKGKIRQSDNKPGFKPFGRAVRMNDIDGNNLGYLLRDLGPAIEILDRALARDKKHVQAWLEKANCLAEMGRFDDALAILSNASLILPDEYRIPYLSGSIHLHVGQVPLAAQAFALASKKNSDDPAAALWHGITLLSLGKPQEAEVAMDRAISNSESATNRDAERAVHEMFSWYYGRHKYPEAFLWGKKHLPIAKKQPNLFRALAISAYMSEKYDDARELLPEAIKLGGDDALALALLGQIRTTDGKYTEAETLFRRSLKLKETAQVLSQLGSIYLEKLNQPEQAIPVLQRTIDLQPDHYLARFQLASAFKAAGRTPDVELAAWRAYLKTASSIVHPELASQEAPFIKKARARITELEK